MSKCPDCNGTGTITESGCWGNGEECSYPCETCGGTGNIDE